MSQSQPKRLKKGASKGPVIAALALALVAAVAAGGYFGLCAWVKNNGLLLPGTTVAGLPGGESVDIGGMEAAAASSLLSASLSEELEDRSLTVTFGDQTALLEGSLLTTDHQAPVDQALEEKAAQPFLQLGVLWLGAGQGSQQTVSALALSGEGQMRVDNLAAQISQAMYVAPVDDAYEVTGETVELTRGVDGQQVDQAEVASQIENALVSGQAALAVTPEVLPASRQTGESLSELVYVEPQSPTVGSDGKLTPTVIGHSLDAAQTQAILDATAPGQACSIPITLTQPEYDESVLFRDVLSSSETYMAGTENRRTNIRLAAKAMNGSIIAPGSVFSYNQTVGERTAAKGYKTATVYVGGEDKQELGGGICQLASALYNCTLYANLEVVDRINHRFAVTYVPYGLDATVAWPTVDYKFRNNTNYPIKISAVTEGNNLYVKFYGTKENNNRVEMKTVQLSTTPFSTVYQVDDSLSKGKTKTLVHAYTGYKYESYRYVYDGNGNLLSKTFEASSTYSYRDKVIGVSSADAAKYGLGDGSPTQEPDNEGGLPTLPVATPTPAPTEAPAPSTPEPTAAPEPTPEPVPTEAPAPEPTQDPIPTEAPPAEPEPTPREDIPI